MDGDFTWLGVVIVIGSMVSLAYYLRVIAAMWMAGPRRSAPMPALAGGVAGGRRRSPRVRRADAGAVAIAVPRRCRDGVLRDHPEPAAGRRGGRRPRTLGRSTSDVATALAWPGFGAPPSE